MTTPEGKEFLNQYVGKIAETEPEGFEEGPDYPSFTNDLTSGAVTRFRSPLG